MPLMASFPGRKSKADEYTEAASAGNLRRIKKLNKELEDGKGTTGTIASIRDSEGRGVLHAAALKGRTSVCKYLVEELKLHVDEKDGEDCTPLLHASLGGHLSTVEYLLDSGADPATLNRHNATALHLAISEGNIEVIHLLLSKGADVNAPSVIGTPLQVAAQHCNPDVLKTLLDNGANPNPAGLIPTPLDFCMSRSLDCTKLLIQGGADPNGRSCGMPPLASATKAGQIEFIKFLLEAGADPNITDDIGLTPIEIAARNGKRKEVEILFPATSPIPACSEWSISGLTKHAHSEKVTQQIKLRVEEKHSKAMSNGDDALRRKDYPVAAYYYTEAIASDPSDAIALSNRSLCLSCLGDGGGAWSDAKTLILLRPDWPESYYRGGVGLILCGNFDMATDTFLLGLKLDPESKVLQDALRRAYEAKTNLFRI